MKCKSETKEELPCPNTCNPGYECKQSETVADFVIGEVAQEGIAEDEKQGVEIEAETELDSSEEQEQQEQQAPVEEIETPDAEI